MRVDAQWAGHAGARAPLRAEKGAGCLDCPPALSLGLAAPLGSSLTHHGDAVAGPGHGHALPPRWAGVCHPRRPGRAHDHPRWNDRGVLLPTPAPVPATPDLAYVWRTQGPDVVGVAVVGGTGLWSSEASPPVGTGAVADTATHTRCWCAPHVTPGALAMAIGLTAHGWTTHAWRSSRVSAACLDQEREHQPPCPRWDACHDER
jgi:hypothetical protein